MTPHAAYRQILSRREARLRRLYYDLFRSGEINAAGLRLLAVCIKATLDDWHASFRDEMAKEKRT